MNLSASILLVRGRDTENPNLGSYMWVTAQLQAEVEQVYITFGLAV